MSPLNSIPAPAKKSDTCSAQSLYIYVKTWLTSWLLAVDEIAKAVSIAVSSVLSKIRRDDEKSSADSSGETPQPPLPKRKKIAGKKRLEPLLLSLKVTAVMLVWVFNISLIAAEVWPRSLMFSL